jgi:protein-S-isoprenylcysteine O-methyltransferase
MSVTIPFTTALGLSFALSEAALAVFKRAKTADASRADRGSLRLLWIVILASVYAAYAVSYAAPQWHIRQTGLCLAAGLTAFAAGLALRWYAIFYLGRFFTVDVAIATDHRLVDSGPYRYIRHPSYTGALLALLGLGSCLCNWASLAVMLAPVLVFVRRMQIEEAALVAGLGDGYRRYMQHTRRLIPGIY